MRAAAQLLGRRGQQRDAGCLRRQCLDCEIFGAGGLGRPFQVVRFVHDQHVPACRQCLLEPLRPMREPAERDDRELLILERVVAGFVGFDGRAAFLVEDREGELETPAHLHEPLHQQRVGQHDQHAAGAAGRQHSRDQHAGLDGLAQAGFVGQQYPRVFAFHAGGNHAKLVRKQFDARRQNPPRVRAPCRRAREQRPFAQFVVMRLVDACRHQSCVRLRKRLLIVELALGEFALFAGIHQQAVVQVDAFDHECNAAAADLLADPEARARQRRPFCRVVADNAGLREQYLHGTLVAAQYGAETEFGFRVGYPALARYVIHRDFAVWKSGYYRASERRVPGGVCPFFDDQAAQGACGLHDAARASDDAAIRMIAMTRSRPTAAAGCGTRR